MTALRVITSGGADTFLDAATVQDFAARLRGSLLRHGDGGYDEARKLFNGMIDHRPALTSAAPARPMSSRRCSSPASTTCSCQSRAVVTASPARLFATAV
jgi:hypothetical protein